jgi:hypothetical protein
LNEEVKKSAHTTGMNCLWWSGFQRPRGGKKNGAGHVMWKAQRAKVTEIFYFFHFFLLVFFNIL